ncbi:MAG: hypothetical protein AAGI23_07385 [Bacteroidota bacterium]
MYEFLEKKNYDMRIIGYIEHPALKITVFKMNNRISVKLESGLYEQTYKFRERDDLANIEQVRQLIDEPFIKAVEKELGQMHQRKLQALQRFLPPAEEDEFDVLI